MFRNSVYKHPPLPRDLQTTESVKGDDAEPVWITNTTVYVISDKPPNIFGIFTPSNEHKLDLS